MGGKVKIRCARCNKSFRSANPKQTLCDDCEAKERAAKAAGKSAAAKPAVVTPTLVTKPRIVGAGARILDPTLPLEPEPAPPQRERPAAPFERPARETHAAPPTPSTQSSPPKERQARVSGGQKERPPRAARPPRAPKSPRSPREPQGPVELTAEQRVLVEARYLELATPVEFDGIRTQIATELGVAKNVVKKAVSELRQRMQMPSWWELQSYKGTDADLERIRAAYTPLLPMPDVGVHKRLAADLKVDQTLVYQAIRRIRAELRLPQYNARDSAEARTSARDEVASEAARIQNH